MNQLHQLLERSAGAHPGRCAVVDPEREVSVNYEQFQKLAESMEARLRAVGVASGDRVGICMPKSIGSLTGVFGALRAGAAYVPVDSTAPAERNARIILLSSDPHCFCETSAIACRSGLPR